MVIIMIMKLLVVPAGTAVVPAVVQESTDNFAEVLPRHCETRPFFHFLPLWYNRPATTNHGSVAASTMQVTVSKCDK